MAGGGLIGPPIFSEAKKSKNVLMSKIDKKLVGTYPSSRILPL
jgi:hypothetical protein